MATDVAVAPRGVDPSSAPDELTLPPGGGRRRTRRYVLGAALLLIVVQLAVRTWVAAQGNFYADDIILAGRSWFLPLWSTDFLLNDHDGHLIPGTYFMAWIATHVAPYQWWAAAATLLLLQVLASLAVLRMLRVLLGDRPALLVPLTFYLFSPLTLPSFAWWITGLNAMAIQAGLAWVAAEAVLLVRTGRRRHAVSGAIAFALCLTVFEKSLLVPVFALSVAYLLLRVTGEERPLRTVLVRGQALWWAVAGVVAVWAWVFLTFTNGPSKAGEPTTAKLAEMGARGVSHGFLPTLFGGPWSWSRAGESMPWTEPPLALIIAGVLATAGVAVWVVRNRRRSGLVLLMVAAYVAANLVAMLLGRVDQNTHIELPQTLRYLADAAVVVAAAMALVMRAPVRERGAQPLLTGRGRRVLLPATVALFLVSSAVSTVTFTSLWATTPAEYLTTARAELAEAGPGSAPILEQTVPPEVVTVFPGPNNTGFQYNLFSFVFGPLQDRPEFAQTTTDLRMLDRSGHLVDATIEPVRHLAPGADPDCGHLVSGSGVTRVPLDQGNLLSWTWVVELNYYANRSGVVEVYLADGAPVRVPVERGPNTVFAQLGGGGDELRLHSTTEGLQLCLPAATLGNLVAAPPG